MYYRAPTSIHPGSPIKLSSQTLASTTTALDARREDRKTFGDEYRRLARGDRPDIRAQTNTSYERPVEHATFDTSGPRVGPGKAETQGAIDEDARLKADVAAVERGESLEDMPDVKTQAATVARKAQATEVVIEKLENEFRAEFQKLNAAYCKTIKADHDKRTREFFELFAKAYSAYSDLSKTKRDLVDSQLGFYGLFNVNLDFLRGEEVRSMFHDAKAAGYVNSIPETLR
jgi:hypothetical protein